MVFLLYVPPHLPKTHFAFCFGGKARLEKNKNLFLCVTESFCLQYISACRVLSSEMDVRMEISEWVAKLKALVEGLDELETEDYVDMIEIGDSCCHIISILLLLPS